MKNSKIIIAIMLILSLSICIFIFTQNGIQPNETAPKATEPKATEPKATEPKATEPKATEPQKITLNKDNIEDLLIVNISSYVQNRTRRAKIEIYPTQPGDFSNAKVAFSISRDIYVTDIKDIKGAQYKVEEFSYGGKYYVLEFTLPADGRHEIDIGFEVLFDTDEPIAFLCFHEPTGTFIPR